MRQIREILRLKYECGQNCGINGSTVSDCLQRAGRAALSWARDAPKGADGRGTEKAAHSVAPIPRNSMRLIPDSSGIYKMGC